MFRYNALWASVGVGVASVWGIAPCASAGIVASQVLNYQPGTVVNSYWGAPYTTPTAALGLPDPTQNVPNVFSNGQQTATADNTAITPFNASYNPANVVAIQNSGGTITLQLSSPVIVGAGAEIGIHAAVGLEDSSYPSGQNTNPATLYTSPRQADLQVSDGTKWVDLGDQTFSNPTNIYTDATDPYGATPGTTLANFFQPFTGSLSSFNGEDFAQVLATLGGSGGGTWFDVSGVGLSQIDDVRLSTSSGEELLLDAVVATSAGSTVTSPPVSPPTSPVSPPVSPPTSPPTSPTSPPPPAAVPLPEAWAMAATLAPFASLSLRRRRSRKR